MKQKIFFAIPCGHFFKNQKQIIEELCSQYSIDSVINEDDPTTNQLWSAITEQIDDCDYFITDISSKSPNVIIELGYALKCKPIQKVGIFIADSIDSISDLNGVTRQTYTSYANFSDKLSNWIHQNVPTSSPTAILKAHAHFKYDEDFKDRNRIINSWYFPPGCQYKVNSKGLQFANAHLPIVSTHLGLLNNYSFEFDGEIIKTAIGWVVKCSRNFYDIIPNYCIMFNINLNGFLQGHILNMKKPDPQHLYTPIPSLGFDTGIAISPSTPINIKNEFLDDNLKIYLNGVQILDKTFAPNEFGLYENIPGQGQIGFRCWGQAEEGLVNNIKILEL